MVGDIKVTTTGAYPDAPTHEYVINTVDGAKISPTTPTSFSTHHGLGHIFQQPCNEIPAPAQVFSQTIRSSLSLITTVATAVIIVYDHGALFHHHNRSKLMRAFNSIQ